MTASASRRPRARRDVALRSFALSLVATAVSAALSACGSPARSVTVPALPMSASTLIGTTAWASLPMGILSERVNTFWELFGRVEGHWVLSTPPGIATNGGVLAAPGPGSSVTSGVVPSFALGFSPIAATSAPGGAWTTGVLPAGLVRAPDAVTVTPAGRRFALLTGSSVVLVSSSSGLSSWNVVATDRGISLATRPQGCDFVSLSAVAVARGGSVLVGGRCRHGSRLPIAVLHGAAWRLATSSQRGLDGDVLRMRTTPEGVVAIVESDLHHQLVLVTASSRDGASWTEGVPLHLPDDGSVVSASLGEGGGAAVVLQSSSGARTADSLGAGARRWVPLPPLPGGSVDVVIGAPTQALAASHSTLLVYEEQHGAWRVVERLQVPIEYGSSG